MILSKEFSINYKFSTTFNSKIITEHDEFFDFDGPEVTNASLLGHPRTKAEYVISTFFAEESQDLEILNRYPEIENIFLKYNTPLPSSAPVERLFSYATMINSPKANKLSDQLFEERY
ncbi:hypothetical protein ABEB36_015137 [Hypothenemus hampei]|uniref:HAT C-terminal dimerisation domain-containing protein n=1 Tax=Hypothenemus hampei TaxID=57062 RepID=A0ABD1E391_HYPHA